MGQQPLAGQKPAVEFDGVSVRYRDRLVASDVCLKIPQTRITALIGPSGSGKSSLLQAINRLTDLLPGCHVSGSIRVSGTDVSRDDVDVQQLRRRVGMIFQKPTPFPVSIRRNLELPLREIGVSNRQQLGRVVEETLQSVGLWDEVHTRLDEPATKLSGGQQQRLCLARTLTLNPEVLLLDEPCSALDPQSTQVIENLLLEMRGRCTIVIVTHNLAQARRLADRVALLWPIDGVGRLIECGDTQQMFESPQRSETADYVSGRAG